MSLKITACDYAYGLDEQVASTAIATLGVRNGATFILTILMYQLKSVVYYLVMVYITSVVSVSTGVSPQFIGKPKIKGLLWLKH